MFNFTLYFLTSMDFTASARALDRRTLISLLPSGEAYQRISTVASLWFFKKVATRSTLGI